jgi:cystathionine beta-lyase/cystathionine gamma-synthase
MGKQCREEAFYIDIHTLSVQIPEVDWPKNAAAPPIYQTSAYTYHSVEQVDRLLSGGDSGYTYSRGANPTCDALAQVIAELEGAEAAVIAASGMGAILAGILALSPTAAPVILSREIYGGTPGLVRQVLQPLGYTLYWLDTHNEAEVAHTLREHAGVLIVESISNPLGRVSPLDTLIAVAHQTGSRVLVDNTFATPYHARPLRFGADLVAHSVTKYIGGHSDLIAGALVGSQELTQRAAQFLNVMGITPDPFAAWLALRGVRTLALRMERASENALTLSTALSGHASLERVYYPGLPSHPDYAVAKRLLDRGYGAIVGLSLKGGHRAVERFTQSLKLVPFLPSLGDVMTTVSHPVVASHRELTVAEQRAVAIDDSVLRVSVGIENAQDLIEDFRQALEHADTT